MKLKLTESDIKILKIVSQIAAGFTLLVSLTMIYSLVQLKTINPLDNPALLQIKEQFDKDPANTIKAEQVRAMDLMARKAYFSSRWQVESGTYLLIAGAIIFILCQQLIAGNEKINPVLSETKPDDFNRMKKARNYLLASGIVISLTAVAFSFLLRKELPDLSGGKKTESAEENSSSGSIPKPDKTNFPFFRGEGGRGIAGGSDYPVEWDGSAGKNIEWKTEVPRKGQSSPVIWGDKIFLTGSSDKICEVYCFDKKSGKILWTGSVSGVDGEPAEEPKTDMDTGIAASSVATNGEYACAVFANGNLASFDMDGNRKWAINLGVPLSSYGYSSSLIIYDNLLIVQFDSDTKISLLGIDIETGAQKWETLRQGRAVWSSPVISYFGGKPQVIINGNPNVTAYDPASGTELWSIECLTGDVAPSVAANSSMVYAVTDYAKLAAIKPGAGVSIAWEDNTFTPDVSSPVANDKYLFLSTGNGDIACYNAQKGDTLWTHYFMDQFYASPIIAGDNVYMLDRSGVMHIVGASDKFKIISESAIGENTDSSPAFSDKKIFIRGKQNLYCISD